MNVLRPYVRQQEGSALLVTLVMITVMTVLIGAALALHVAQRRLIRRDAHRLQARYAAEAGVYVAIDSLQMRPFWNVADGVMDLPEAQESRVTVERFGGYLLIRSEARYRRSRATVRALVGEVPPAAFHRAILLSDVQSSLYVAGRTRITGDIVVGSRGVKESTFKRRPFTGRVRGAVYKVPDLQAPFFDGSFLQGAVDGMDQLLLASPGSSRKAAPPRPLATSLPGENPVHLVAGSLRLTAADSMLLREPLTVVAWGDLTLQGPLRFEPGTIFVAGRALRIEEGVAGREGLFYGRERIETSGVVRCAGQFFSRKDIRVARDAYLAYPSVLYVTGEAADLGGGIVVEDGAVVDGTLVHPPLDPRPVKARGRIIVEPAAQVRGAIFNALETEFHGTLYGAMLTHQFYFYESPTSYVNWLLDAVIDVGERPVKYVLPLLFSPAPRLAVQHWEAYVEESDPYRAPEIAPPGHAP